MIVVKLVIVWPHVVLVFGRDELFGGEEDDRVARTP